MTHVNDTGPGRRAHALSRGLFESCHLPRDNDRDGACHALSPVGVMQHPSAERCVVRKSAYLGERLCGATFGGGFDGEIARKGTRQ